MSSIIKESYKQTRRDDDKNQPKAIQPWFSDTWRRKYWLIEGIDDTHFRIYRENDGKTSKTNTWFSVAGTIDEVNALATKFEEDGTTLGKQNGARLRAAVPRFEAGEEKRRKKEYRVQRKKMFQKPDLGWGLYEGRTRGKRMRYTYEDEDGGDSEETRRSLRDTSGYATPVEGPVVTSSGRQVKSRVGGVYGESMLMDQRKEIETQQENGRDTSEDMDMPATEGKTTRRGRVVKPTREQYDDGGDSDSNAAESSGKEWSGNEDEPDESEPELDDEAEDDEVGADDFDGEGEDDNTQESLVVQLRYRKGGNDGKERSPLVPVTNGEHASGLSKMQDIKKGAPMKLPQDGFNGQPEAAPQASIQQRYVGAEPQKLASGSGFSNGSLQHHPSVQSVQPMDIS